MWALMHLQIKVFLFFFFFSFLGFFVSFSLQLLGKFILPPMPARNLVAQQAMSLLLVLLPGGLEQSINVPEACATRHEVGDISDQHSWPHGQE